MLKNLRRAARLDRECLYRGGRRWKGSGVAATGVKGPVISDDSIPMRSTIARPTRVSFEIAPASNKIQLEFIFPEVKQITPTFDDSKFSAIFALHLAPTSMSSEDNHGSASLIMLGR